MSKFIQVIRQFGDFLVKAILVLNVFGFTWWALKFVMPLSLYWAFNKYLLYTITMSYCLLIPALLISNFRNRILACVLAIPVLAGFVIASYCVESPLDTVRLGAYRFHLTEQATLTDWWGLYSLYQCNDLDTGCKRIEGWENFYKPSDLVADERTNSVYFFENGHLDLIYSLSGHWCMKV